MGQAVGWESSQAQQEVWEGWKAKLDACKAGAALDAWEAGTALDAWEAGAEAWEAGAAQEAWEDCAGAEGGAEPGSFQGGMMAGVSGAAYRKSPMFSLYHRCHPTARSW